MKLAESDLLRLLPEHISGDPQFSAAGKAAGGPLKALSLSIPSLLIYARLGEADPARFLAPLRRLTEARPGLAPLDMETLESLAWQFHVDFREAASTRDQLAAMVRSAIAWHRIKGTPASIRKALALFGYSGIEIEEHTPAMPWATYQLGLENFHEMDDVRRVVAICREMQPARCRLWRVYSAGFDMRPGIWSGPGKYGRWSHAYWSSYSGAEIPDIPGLGDSGLIVSFGRKDFFQSGPWTGLYAGLAILENRGYRIFVNPRPIWSVSRWSEKFFHHKVFALAAFSAFHGCELIWDKAQAWQDKPWPNEPWAEDVRWDRRLPEWEIKPSGICKSQGVYSDFTLIGWPWTKEKQWPDHPWGEARHYKTPSAWSAPNCNWSWPVIRHVHYDDAVWSETDYSAAAGEKIRYEIVGEQFYENRAALVNPKQDIPAWNDLPEWPQKPWWQELTHVGGRLESFGESALAGTLKRLLAPVWSESGWSDFYSKWRGALVNFEHAALIADWLPWPARQWQGDFWPDAVWESGGTVKLKGEIWPDAVWPEKPWGDGPHNLKGEGGFCPANADAVLAPIEAFSTDFAAYVQNAAVLHGADESWANLPWQAMPWGRAPASVFGGQSGATQGQAADMRLQTAAWDSAAFMGGNSRASAKSGFAAANTICASGIIPGKWRDATWPDEPWWMPAEAE